jgi:NADPH:quinone reductase-like Zn-dependent oxidoreductase
MKAIVLEGFGGVDQLQLEEVDDPQPGAGEVLVRVHATSVNPIDWKIRSGATKGRIDVELPAILGRDLAGEVVRAGDGVTGFAPGQRVMGLANGTYAELTTVKADVLAPIPDKLSYEQAAALPLVLLTGAQLIERGIKIGPGQTVLVLGAVGSVGRTAVHVALSHGARVIAGVRGAQVEGVKSLGAERVVSTDDPKALDLLHDLDAVADTIDGPVASRALRTLRPGGVFGTVVGPPADASKYDVRVAAISSVPDASRLYELADEVARGVFTIPIAKILPLEKVGEAQSEAESGKVSGKIVLRAA